MARPKTRKYVLKAAYREMLQQLLDDDGKTRDALARQMNLGLRRLQIALSGEAVVREVVRKIAEWLAKQRDQDSGTPFTGTWSDLCDGVMEAEVSPPTSAPGTPGMDGSPPDASGSSGPHPPFRQTAVHLELPDEIAVEGGRPLVGTVEVQGSRNTLPKQLIAALLTREKCVLHSVPNLTDMLVVAEMIWRLGGTVHRDGRSIVVSTAKIRADNMAHLPAFHGTTRVSILLLAPLLHRFKSAFVPKQGGCPLGKRDVTFHLDALERMGATIEAKPDGSIVASAPNGLEGRVIELPHPSVGATEQILLAGSLAHGTTKISNAAIDPEVIDLASCLQDMGCQVSWNRQREITITGNRLDDMRGYDFVPMNDRSEIGSWACAALASDGSVTIKNAVPKDLEGVLQEYEGVGGGLEVLPDGVRCFRKSKLTPIAIETGSHPRFRTDWQPPFVAMLTQASGKSYVHETVFEDRLGYVAALRERMGANIDTFDTCLGTICCHFIKKHIHSARVCGPTKLSPGDLHVRDLRGGFAYLTAALVAHGRSRICNLRSLQKGYDDVVSKLVRLEANVTAL